MEYELARGSIVSDEDIEKKRVRFFAKERRGSLASRVR